MCMVEEGQESTREDGIVLTNTSVPPKMYLQMLKEDFKTDVAMSL